MKIVKEAYHSWGAEGRFHDQPAFLELWECPLTDTRFVFQRSRFHHVELQWQLGDYAGLQGSRYSCVRHTVGLCEWLLFFVSVIFPSAPRAWAEQFLTVSSVITIITHPSLFFVVLNAQLRSFSHTSTWRVEHAFSHIRAADPWVLCTLFFLYSM